MVMVSLYVPASFPVGRPGRVSTSDLLEPPTPERARFVRVVPPDGTVWLSKVMV